MTRKIIKGARDNVTPEQNGKVLELLAQCEERGFEPTYAQLLAEVSHQERREAEFEIAHEKALQFIANYGQAPLPSRPHLRIVYSRD